MAQLSDWRSGGLWSLSRSFQGKKTMRAGVGMYHLKSEKCPENRFHLKQYETWSGTSSLFQ